MCVVRGVILHTRTPRYTTLPVAKAAGTDRRSVNPHEIALKILISLGDLLKLPGQI